MKKFSIPKMSMDDVIALSDSMRPVCRYRGQLMWLEKVNDLFRISYLWNVVMEGVVGDDELVEVGRIKTLHSYGHPSLFKPSVAEVMAQIPKEYHGKATAYELVIPKYFHDPDSPEFQQGFHVAEVILYEKKNGATKQDGDFQYLEWNSHRYVKYTDAKGVPCITHDPDCPNCPNCKPKHIGGPK